MKLRLWLSILVVTVCASLGMQACTHKEDEIVGKVLSLALADNVKSLDPAVAYDVISLEVMSLTMESLFQYKYAKSPLELEPLLADGMPTVSKDGKTYTIKIKKGVLWQDDPAFPNGKGRELKAQDFIYAWKRMLLPKVESPGTWIFEGKVAGFDEFKKKIVTDSANAEAHLAEEIEGLKASDDYTIQIKLTQAYPQLLNVLAMGFGAPMAKEVVDKYGQEGFSERMVGTGPFRLKSFVKGSRIILEKSPTFRGELFPSEGDEEAKKSGLLAAAGQKLPFVEDRKSTRLNSSH